MSIAEGSTVINIRRDTQGEVLSVWNNLDWVKWESREEPMNERIDRLIPKNA